MTDNDTGTVMSILDSCKITDQSGGGQPTKRKQPFLASIPLLWLLRAGSLSGKALHVAIMIRHQSRLEGMQTISLKNKLLFQMGVSRDAKRRALRLLMAAGIITVTQRIGGNPQVTIIEIE